MGLINSNLKSLKETDRWSFILFSLFKLTEIPEYSALSELCYVLDKDNMLRFFEIFGGTTLKVPTISDLETMIYGLMLYEYVHTDHLTFDEAINNLPEDVQKNRAVKSAYLSIKNTLENYRFTKREVNS